MISGTFNEVIIEEIISTSSFCCLAFFWISLSIDEKLPTMVPITMDPKKMIIEAVKISIVVEGIISFPTKPKIA